MILFRKAGSLTNYLRQKEHFHGKPSFVPTMGAIHEGHISLITNAKKEAGFCVASIFVNPTQFNNHDDFSRYPVSLEKDIDMLEKAGCDVLFLPSIEEIYPAGYKAPQYELGYLETVFEGKFRPGHFQGVCQVVDRLLEIINPSKLFLGQKDYQQCKVLKKLVELKGYNIDVVVSPTLREPSGLAMSSRNRRLSGLQVAEASEIYNQLKYIKDNYKSIEIRELVIKATVTLEKKGFKVDYLDVVDGNTLNKIYTWNGTSPLVALVAATIDQVRLIDNLVLHG